MMKNGGNKSFDTLPVKSMLWNYFHRSERYSLFRIQEDGGNSRAFQVMIFLIRAPAEGKEISVHFKLNIDHNAPVGTNFR